MRSIRSFDAPPSGTCRSDRNTATTVLEDRLQSSSVRRETMVVQNPPTNQCAHEQPSIWTAGPHGVVPLFCRARPSCLQSKPSLRVPLSEPWTRLA
jgi:hypothetical protein